MAKNLIMRIAGTNQGKTVLEPAYQDGEQIISKLRTGNFYKVTLKLSRNPEFNKLAFAFLNKVFEYQHDYTDREMLRTRLSIDAGHIDQWEFDGERIAFKVRSWAFDEMDELEFKPLIAKIVAAAIKRFDLPPGAPWIPHIFVEDHDH